MSVFQTNATLPDLLTNLTKQVLQGKENLIEGDTTRQSFFIHSNMVMASRKLVYGGVSVTEVEIFTDKPSS